MITRNVILTTYGEPPSPHFREQLAYSWRLLTELTRTIAPIPKAVLPAIALSRAGRRSLTWRRERYGSPLEAQTVSQARALEQILEHRDPATRWQVRVAYEFRDPGLGAVLSRLPHGPCDIIPMYVADSAFTHELSRAAARNWVGGLAVAPPLRVLPPLEEEDFARVSAEHVLKEISERRISLDERTGLVLAAHGAPLEPPGAMQTGREATERIANTMADRLGPHFTHI